MTDPRPAASSIARSTFSPRARWSFSACGIETAARVRRLPFHPLAKEADDVIDAEAIEQLRGVRRARAKPAEVVLIHRRPQVRGEAPALAVGGEVVGRRAERDVGLELIAVSPHVGALASDDERHVAHERDASELQLGASGAPLLVREPLEVHLLEDLRTEPAVVTRRGREREDLRSSIAFVRRPGRPAVPGVRRAEGGVERVVTQPCALALDEREELSRPRRVLRELTLTEARERLAEHAPLQPANRGVVDARRAAQALELGATFVPERALHEIGVRLGRRLDRDVDRVEREGGERAVRAGLPLRELVRGEHLDEPLPRAEEEPRRRRQVGDLSNAPVCARTHREERNRHPREPGHRHAGSFAHGAPACKHSVTQARGTTGPLLAYLLILARPMAARRELRPGC